MTSVAASSGPPESRDSLYLAELFTITDASAGAGLTADPKRKLTQAGSAS